MSLPNLEKERDEYSDSTLRLGENFIFDFVYEIKIEICQVNYTFQNVG